MKISISIGDICDVNAVSIVNAAKPQLTGGGGVDGMVHRCAGPELLEACLELPVLEGKDIRCPVGAAKHTPAFGLLLRKNKHVIHTAGPIYKDFGATSSAPYLKSCYQQCMLHASTLGESVAFPAIGTGIYGYPLEDATVIAIKTVGELAKTRPGDFGDMTVKFVCYDEANYLVYRRVLESHLENWEHFGFI
jgi:O-acetyl-ADP-ribose deacetylase (regulator of RNase III)